MLLERSKEFKTKADAHISELVLKRPRCLAELVCLQSRAEEHLPLDLPAESDHEILNARGIHIELKNIQRLQKKDPIDKEIVARHIRMCIPYWVRNYKGTCPKSFSQLISHLEALATCLEGTSTAERPANPAKRRGTHT